MLRLYWEAHAEPDKISHVRVNQDFRARLSAYFFLSGE
jgi:hypothetical protein